MTNGLLCIGDNVVDLYLDRGVFFPGGNALNVAVVDMFAGKGSPQAIVDAVKTTLDRTPPELAADIMEQGIMITGGGALLAGLDRRLSHETGMPINIARDPLFSVVIGSGRALENIDAMRGLMSLGGDD